MTIATYTELVSELGSYLNRADLDAKIPLFIRLFEARANRRLRSPDSETAFTFTTVSGTDTYPLSSGVRELRTLKVDTATDAQLDYTVRGESIYFNPAPSGEYTVTYTAYVTLPSLGTGQATNWLLDDHPDAYLFGALAEAYAHIRDDAAASQYLSLSEAILDEIIREANEKRMPPGPLVMRALRGEAVITPTTATNYTGEDPGDLTGYL